MDYKQFTSADREYQLWYLYNGITATGANGTTATGEVVPLLVDNQGRLATDLEFSGTVSIGTVAIDQSAPDANGVSVKDSALPVGASTETTAASILTKLADPATSAKQDSSKSVLDDILAKITGSAATAGNQTTANASLSSIDGKVATQTTLASILALITAEVGTEATLAAILAKLTAVNTGAVVVSSGSVTANDPAVSVAKSTSLSASLIVKASAGSMFSLTGYNSGPAQWVQVHNAASVPANAAIPLAVVAVPAQSTFAFEWGKGLPCSTGIVLCNSYGADPATAAAQKTIGSNDCFFTATYL